MGPMVSALPVTLVVVAAASVAVVPANAVIQSPAGIPEPEIAAPISAVVIPVVAVTDVLVWVVPVAAEVPREYAKMQPFPAALVQLLIVLFTLSTLKKRKSVPAVVIVPLEVHALAPLLQNSEMGEGYGKCPAVVSVKPLMDATGVPMTLETIGMRYRFPPAAPVFPNTQRLPEGGSDDE